MRFDPLSFVIGKYGDFAPVRDVVSYLIGSAASGAIWQTITNVAVASFTSVSTTLRDLVIDVVPVQSGSGNPSPTNVRPISGWTGANIVVSPTLDAADGITYHVSWQSEVGTVYGGTLRDNGDGTWTLIPSMASVDLGNLSWTAQSLSGGRTAFITPVSGLPESPSVSNDNPPIARSSIAAPTYQNASSWGTNSFLFVSTSPTILGKNLVFIFDSTAYSDATAFKAAMDENIFVYRSTDVMTPVVLTAGSVKARLGTNNIFADTGNINTITFRTY